MFVFPAHLFNPGKVRVHLARTTLSGGASLTGDEDHVITDGGGRWEVTYEDISLDSPELINAWEAWNGYLAAGTVQVTVPVLSLETAPRPMQGRRPMPPSALAVDDPLFPTSVGFAAPYIVAVVAANAALRATTLEIVVSRGAALGGGEKFEIAGRVHRIARKIDETHFIIEPALRAAVTAGTAINFDWPCVICHAVPGEDWSPAIEFGQFADTSIRFVESFAS